MEGLKKDIWVIYRKVLKVCKKFWVIINNLKIRSCFIKFLILKINKLWKKSKFKKFKIEWNLKNSKFGNLLKYQIFKIKKLVKF